MSRYTPRTRRLSVLALPAALSLTLPAAAITIRGRITDPEGRALPGARVQLIQSGRSVARAAADSHGNFVITSADSGRFTLLGSGPGFLPAIGQDFYGGAKDLLLRDVVLSPLTVHQEISVTATTLPTPLPQLTAPVSVIDATALATRVNLVDELRQTLSADVVQTGQYGGVTSLFLRGGNSTANLVTIDGMPANDVGGTFDFTNVSSTGIAKTEVYRGPDSATWGTDAGAGVVSIATPRGNALRPQLDYRGEGGNLTTYRNEVTGSGAWNRLDYLAGFSRFDSSNALQLDRYHLETAVANLGFAVNGNTGLRATVRYNSAATGLPGAHDFYGLSADGKQGDQDLYGTLSAENTLSHWHWHNLVRYGIARKREQASYFGDVGNPITFNFGYLYTEYFGNLVTIRGANGYTATGQAAFLTGDSQQDSNRDQLYWQSDWTPSPHFNALFGFRYDNERGSFQSGTETPYGTQRNNFEYNLQFQGEWFSRLFYSLGGAVEKNHLYGLAGTPRFGLAYVLIPPRDGWFGGTRLRANAATGVQEPTLALEYYSLYRQLQLAGDTADIAAYSLTPPDAERSRNYDLGIDQSIYGSALILKAGLFHNEFNRQLEGVSGQTLATDFGIASANFLNNFSYDTFYINSLAYRAEGAEGELDFQPERRILLRAGYTYLDAKVLQSFASDAVAAQDGMPTENPNLPGIAIGAESPLIGGRPFRRPPHSGFFSATYSGVKWTGMIKGAFASRADDSTYLDGYTPSFDNSLLLPNRDLDFGYTRLDLGGSYSVTTNAQLFAELDNALNNQHIGPIGYPGLPLTVRAGVKVRFGGDRTR